MSRRDRMNRVEELTSLLLDESLGGEGRAELNELLRGDPDACERYLDIVECHAALLHDHVGDELIASLPEKATLESVVGEKVFGRRSAGLLVLAAAFGLLLVGLALLRPLGSSSGKAEEPQSNRDWVAVISRAVDAEWEGTAKGLTEGDAIGPGELHLATGLAQIEFFSGASVIVEGPAELRLFSTTLVECRKGRLQAFVPEPAQGFTILTPEFSAVDLGTEFVLSVGGDGFSEVHVVDGEVRLDGGDGRELRRLTSGTGLRAVQGKFEAVDGGGSGFIGGRQLLGLAEADWQARFRRWAESRDVLGSDPDTLVFFDFEHHEPWDRQLRNRRTEGPGGAIIGARWTEGRWPGKGALEFKRITDRVRLHLPGEFEALTLAARVRIEGLDRWLSSLILTDGFGPGEVHWQLSDQGEIVLGIAVEGGLPNTVSPAVIRPEDLGRWMHLATTVDRKSGRVAHYLDGEVVTVDFRPGLPPLRIGNAEIGNWRPLGKTHPIRSFNGRIDEFLILRRAMTEGEIRQIYESGR